jgi:pimeloyl-ACP methyl ester carboxylesterase
MARRSLELALADPGADEEPLVINVLDRLGEIAAPTLVLVGELDVPDMHAVAELIERELPNARRETVDGTAHLPSMERPEEVDRLVTAFLGEAEL